MPVFYVLGQSFQDVQMILTPADFLIFSLFCSLKSTVDVIFHVGKQ